ncbi:leucine-rich repeat receptor protein kinase HPCA1-like [Bidens hawaiensis]|uniref:leucine-rich repeat receptor protein kinase HPCA1-like n=1 Tax=Bidens hawaiensis TaxID=980011 RepID=UPI00404B70C1
MHLSNNRLTGPIRSQLFHSNMSLIHIIFNKNQLSGSIPSSIGSIKTLEVVRLDSNSLSGPVPQNLSNLQTVTELYLSNNKLSGPVPNLLGMNSLSYVDMSNNSFDTSDIPSWFTLLPLNTILMENTQLQGDIPTDMFQPHLESL